MNVLPYKDPEKRKEYCKKYYQEHIEEHKERTREWKKRNPEKVRDSNKKWRKSNPESDRKSNKKSRAKNREKCLIYYSSKNFPVCICCNESDINKLSLDHIHGNGRKHRKYYNLKSGSCIYRLLIKNNFPEGYQILCYNCNCGKSDKKVCPHTLSKEELDNYTSTEYYKCLRIPILKKFSNNDIKCIRCDEKNILFLNIDHINGGGAEHIRSFTSRKRYDKYLRDEAPISDFQILCYNCNILKYRKGIDL